MLSDYKLADNVTEVHPCDQQGIFCWKMSNLRIIYTKKVSYVWGCPHGGIYLVFE